MISALQKAFPEYRLTCAEGGRTSFDVFPRTWDKTLALQKLQGEGFEEIHYFGDKTHKASIYISQCSCMSLTQRCLTGRQWPWNIQWRTSHWAQRLWARGDATPHWGDFYDFTRLMGAVCELLAAYTWLFWMHWSVIRNCRSGSTGTVSKNIGWSDAQGHFYSLRTRCATRGSLISLDRTCMMFLGEHPRLAWYRSMS